MGDFFDDLDAQQAAAREQSLFASFGARLEEATRSCPGLANHLNGVNLASINSREALQALPVLRKNELMAAQQQDPPFGGFVNPDALIGTRVFMSPGPVWEPQVGSADPWESARSLHAAGFRSGDRVHNTFSYHQTPGGFILDEGARALGCAIFPAGTGNTEAQVAAMGQFGATAFVGTPDYLQTVLSYAEENHIELPKLKRAMVSGGALFPAMREKFKSSGVHVQQCYATADLGVVAYESHTNGEIHPGMLVNEHLIVEIVKPGTGEPVAAGEVGELVITRLNNQYPLVRFATADMSMFLPDASPCGRTAMRIAGWMGRADQRTKVRGMFVDPTQVQAVRQKHAELDAVRLVVDRDGDRDVMTLQIWPKSDYLAEFAGNSAQIDAIVQSVKQITGLSGSVTLMNEAIPTDGVVVQDKRDYSS